jgi:hypothetical protein
MRAATADTVPESENFRPESLRGTDGYFRVAQNRAGQWWLIDPAGRPTWMRAVHGVRVAPAAGDSGVPRDTAAQLRDWGFDTVGVDGDTAGRDDGLAFLAAVEFCNAAPAITAPGLRLPDVFDPAWPALAQEHAAAVCAAFAGQRKLVGWVTDSSVAWAQPAAHAAAATGAAAPCRPSLLQLCLSLEPRHAAYHAAWEFALALHGGRLDSLARAWGTPLANKEVVREQTRAEVGLSTRGYLRDEIRWTHEFARRYFSSTSAAIRAADPNHLVFGCRFSGSNATSASVLAECTYPLVDAAMPDWRELPAPTDAGAKNPLLAGDVCWTTKDFFRLPTAARVLRLTSVEWMLRRGRTALERAARHPAVIGYVWREWQDQPGEQPPFASGLVHVNGIEAREHTELLTEFNRRAESLRRGAALPTSS